MAAKLRGLDGGKSRVGIVQRVRSIGEGVLAREPGDFDFIVDFGL